MFKYKIHQSVKFLRNVEWSQWFNKKRNDIQFLTFMRNLLIIIKKKDRRWEVGMAGVGGGNGDNCT